VSVAAVCRRLGMSRQNYYAQRRRRQQQWIDGEMIKQLVVRERKQQSRLGGRKLHWMLAKELAEAGIKVGRDRFFKVLAQKDLLLEPKPAAYPCTTSSGHCLPVFGNQIKGMELERSNQVWVSDITYVRTWEGFLYLALITDKWSRKVVGHHCGESLSAEGCLQALEQALQELPLDACPIHHSDRGSQYCCHEYVQRLNQRQLGVSMTERDHCAENALAERMNGILKQEYGLGVEFRTKAQARRAVAQSIWLYNTRRPHTALGYRVPEEMHRSGLN